MNPFKNYEEYKRNVEKFKRDVDKIVKDSVEEAAGYAEAEAKRNSPIEFGNHRRNIKGSTVNNGYTARLNANADYAPYLEFGTGGLVDIPEGFEKLAATFKGKGIKKINLPARPHIIPAAYKARDFMQKQIEKGIDNL